MKEESIKVAVRVRPFNDREKSRNAKLVISMTGNLTGISNPENPSEIKNFTFDHSYWSHDGFVVDKNGVYVPDSPSSLYASQERVYGDLGTGILKNVFEGYNCSLFAYGQTGSGKSYSMVGYGNNKGIVPITCEHLFEAIDKMKGPQKEFQVTVSMLEIYNEKVRDLLNTNMKAASGLPVRQSSDEGFFVQGLKNVPVGSYKDIEKRMEQGTANRTIAATNMNETSSRAHTLVSISFDQISSEGGSTKRLSSTINFVDLAGSERAESTGATGDRLKEGANINRSLSVLANVISALADKKKVVPYRDSVLTKLLQNALGGSSKTVMVAALSPADINYAETLSTLRYADRAKQIKTKAIVNNKLQENVLKELMAENERLKKQLQEMMQEADVAATPGITSEERARMREEIRMEIMAQLENNRERLENQNKDVFKKKLEEARKEATNIQMSIAVRPSAKIRPKCPFLTNLNEDPQLSGVIIHYLNAEKVIVGREGAPGNLNLENKERRSSGKVSYILLRGLNIQDTHAIFTRLPDGRMELSVGPNSLRNTKVNGTIITTSVILAPMDRILFGSYHLYVFHTNDKESGNTPVNIDWDFAQKELAKSEGIDQFDKAMDENDRSTLQQQLVELLPMLQEVNSIAKEMGKQRTFEIVLLPGLLQQTIYGQHKAANILTEELYQAFEDGSVGHTSINREEDDPFWEPLEPLLVGFAPAFLQSLSYGLDYSDRLQISDLDGETIGKLAVNLQPCLANGEVPGSEGLFVENPKKLVGKPFHFKVEISKISLPGLLHGTNTSLRYCVYREEKPTVIRLDASEIKGHRGKLNISHSRQITFNKVTREILTYFEKECIAFLVYADQGDTETLDVKPSDSHLIPEATSQKIRRGSLAAVVSIDDRFRSSLQHKLEKKRAPNVRDSRDEEVKISDILEVDADGHEDCVKENIRDETSKKNNPINFAKNALKRQK
ncbi:hypothetical protein Aperf_G00000055836 [Anoplocephala perfoliata]